MSDKQLLFLCEETGLGDAAMSPQAQTFLSMENFYETHSLAIPGPSEWRFAYCLHAFDSLPLIWGVFCSFVLLDFAFSLQLCFITNYKYSFKTMCFRKQHHLDKLNLKTFAHRNLDPIFYILNAFCPTFTIRSTTWHLPYNLRRRSLLIWA